MDDALRVSMKLDRLEQVMWDCDLDFGRDESCLRNTRQTYQTSRLPSYWSCMSRLREGRFALLVSCVCLGIYVPSTNPGWPSSIVRGSEGPRGDLINLTMSSHLPSSTFPPAPSGTTSTSQRPLTLTSELERIEQSITLTLQEIDAHFSVTHRILTTSILPLVARYGDHSQSVWESTKFWKQFFEIRIWGFWRHLITNDKNVMVVHTVEAIAGEDWHRP